MAKAENNPPSLSESNDAATPIVAVTKLGLPEWLERNPKHRAWIAANAFDAAPGAFVLLPGEDGHAEAVLAAPNEGPKIWAFAGLPTALPDGRYRFDTPLDQDVATSTALGWALGSYSFATYKKPKRAPAELTWPAEAERAEVRRLARAVTLARDLINTPAEDMGPDHLIAAGAEIAEAAGAQTRIVRGDALLRENYPTIHAVGRASTREPGLLDMRWGDESAPRVTLVGKGVCFDTGGLDIKPHEGMLEMKKDMGGAAIVLALAQALMDAGAPIRLRVLIPAVENSVAGNAIRPRDIIRTRAGKTVEIGNTDAEGRLILCDALADADAEAPDLLLDCATLTGAAKIALGPEVQALYCDDDATALELQSQSLALGDPLWRMPIWRPYRKMLDGKCADLNNVAAGPLAGSIIAALYLAEFVSAAKTWSHLDIMAANVKDRPGRPEGGEATGLLALYSYIRGRYA
jgi:leucyl aminopeptidase